MNIQENLIKQTIGATQELFRIAHTFPADKLTWQVNENSRTALDIIAECALAPLWAVEVVAKGAFAPDPDMMEKYMAAKSAIKTVEEAEAICAKNCETLYQTIRDFPEERLLETVSIPFGPNPEWEWAQLLGIHAWNCVYHLGQLNFIQTLYGDKEMH